MNDSFSNESAFRFEHLAVDRMYGRRFDLELDEIGRGVNVIAGPNGSGKTTLARAMEVLVWPHSHPWKHPIVQGAVQLGGNQWGVEVEASRVQYHRTGGASGQPSVPPPDHRDRYHLYLHDLLRVTEGSEQELVEAILQEAQGGYDIPGAAAELGFGTYAKGTLNQTRQLSEARRRVEAAKEKQRRLEEERQSIDRLTRRREKARAAATRREALTQAIRLKEAEKKAQAAEEELCDFPPEMDAVQGDEAQRLSDLHEERKEAVSNREEAAGEMADAQTSIDENRLPEEGLPDGTLDTLRNAVQEWEQAQNAVDQAKRERARAKETEKQEWIRLNGEDKDQVAGIALSEIDRVQSLAEARLELEGKEKALEAMERLFGEAAPDVDPEFLWRGIERLEEWLREPAPSAVGEGNTILRYGGIVLSGLVGLLGAYLGGGGAALGWLVAVAGVALAVAFYVVGSASSAETRRSEVRERFARLDLNAPKAWTPEAVHRRLDDLVRDWAAARLEEAKADEWSRQKSERRKMEEESGRLDREKTTLGEALGVALEVEEHGLLWFVRRLGDWQEAYAEVQSTNREIEAAERQVETWNGKVQACVEPYGIEGVADVADANAALEQIREAQQDLQRAQTEFETAETRVEEAEKRIRSIDEKIEGIFERLEIPIGDDEAVERRCELHSEYEAAKSTAENARRDAELEEERLRSEAGFETSMLAAGIEDLKQQKEEAASLAEKEEDLFDRMSRIQQKVDSAKEEHDLEEALAERQAAREALSRRRKEDLRSVVGQVLADVVHRRTRNQDLPEVFERADERFRQITTDRYHLDVDRENSTFQVVTDDNRWLGLSELSSGTKVQLLLAVRIAFVERQEQGAKLPLVLDEALANSDDVKARSVIEAVRAICRDGRQVFYLTAQSDEVAKWREHLEGTETSLTVHALSGDESAPDGSFKQLGGDGAIRPGRPERPALPDPSQVTHAELEGLLDVPRWSPRLPVETLHLWYLTEDVELLCRAAEKSYRTWGQLSSLADRKGLSLIGLSEEKYRRMDALARAVEAWREAWLIGRGDPVDRPALEETSAVSETFIDEVTALAKRVEGNAERILEELDKGAVKRFRSGKIEELEIYFREEGYLTERDPLGPEACWRRALGEVSDAIGNDRITEETIASVLDRI